MTTDRELMQQALDALEHLQTDIEWQYKSPTRAMLRKVGKSLRARLAQPEQEPVAWMCPDDPEQETAFSWQSGHCVDCGKKKVPVYTTPPQRPWKSLTDAEIKSTASLGIYEKPLIDFARAIEAKLKEKNT